jgi:hypothetical protein
MHSRTYFPFRNLATGDRHELFTHGGSAGNKWNKKNVAVQLGAEIDFGIQFEANTVSRGLGDIAIDDVVFSPQCM